MPLDPCALTLPVPTPHTCVDSHVHGPTCQAPACSYTLQRKGVVGQAGDSQGAVGTRKGRRLLVPSARASPQRKVLWGLPVPRLSPQHLWSHARAMRLWRASHARDGAGQFAQRLRLDEDGNQPIGSL
jgi:hypothetical protein